MHVLARVQVIVNVALAETHFQGTQVCTPITAVMHGTCLHMVMYGSQDIAPMCLMDCAQTSLLTSQMLHLTHHHLQLAEACLPQIHLNRLPLTLQKLYASNLHPLQHC